MDKPVLLEIAKRHLHLETLETRNSDGLDFSDQAVWGLKAALEEAFTAGGQVMVKFARKPSDIQEVLDIACSNAEQAMPTSIIEHLRMTPDEYAAFTGDLLAQHEWMANKGGWSKEKIRLAFKITCPGQLTLYVDPSGHPYARYVGLEV